MGREPPRLLPLDPRELTRLRVPPLEPRELTELFPELRVPPRRAVAFADLPSPLFRDRIEDLPAVPSRCGRDDVRTDDDLLERFLVVSLSDFPVLLSDHLLRARVVKPPVLWERTLV